MWPRASRPLTRLHFVSLHAAFSVCSEARYHWVVSTCNTHVLFLWTWVEITELTGQKRTIREPQCFREYGN